MSTTSTHSNTQPVLHIWPGIEPSLSIDPQCVAALLCLQLYMPMQFSIQHCTDPDLSPSGQLPYLSHGLHTVTGLHAIVKYVFNATHQDPSSSLSSLQKAQATARIAHIETNLGDLVAHVTYALSANWLGKTRPALVNMMSIPQRYYMPERIRLSYQPRLEVAELWSAVGVEKEEEKEKERFSFRRPTRRNRKAEEKVKYKETVQRNKILDKSRSLLDIYAKMLGDARFIFGVERPTALDISLAAHVYVLKQEQPDNLIRDLVLNEYPALIAHVDRVYSAAFPDPSEFPVVLPHSTSFSLSALFPKHPPTQATIVPRPLTEQERKFALMRYTFFGGSVLVATGYIYTQRHAFVQLYRLLQQLLALAETRAGQTLDEHDGEEDEEDDAEEETSISAEEDDEDL